MSAAPTESRLPRLIFGSILAGVSMAIAVASLPYALAAPALTVLPLLALVGAVVGGMIAGHHRTPTGPVRQSPRKPALHTRCGAGPLAHR